MFIKINDKEYQFNFNSQIGPYYQYENLWISSFQDDFNVHSEMFVMTRLAYCILLTDNPQMMAFEDFIKAVPDETLTEMFAFMTERFKVFGQSNQQDEQPTEEGKKG